jgi:hypothetical protein
MLLVSVDDGSFVFGGVDEGVDGDSVRGGDDDVIGSLSKGHSVG